MPFEFFARHSPIKLHPAVVRVARLGHGGIRNIEPEDADVVAAETAEHFLEHDGRAVRFLPRGAGRAQDPDGNGAKSRFVPSVYQFGKQFELKQFERRRLCFAGNSPDPTSLYGGDRPSPSTRYRA